MNAWCSPEAINENDHAISVFIIWMNPGIASAWRSNPAPMRPDPIAIPYPISTNPDGIIKRWRRRGLDEQRRRCPTDGNRLGLNEWRINIYADHRCRSRLNVAYRGRGSRPLDIDRSCSLNRAAGHDEHDQCSNMCYHKFLSHDTLSLMIFEYFIGLFLLNISKQADPLPYFASRILTNMGIAG